MDSPLAPHRATPAELAQRLAAEREGAPFLVARTDDGHQVLATLPDREGRATIGRSEHNDVALAWDDEVSRLHAELERLGGEWTVADDGLSRNGTWVNGTRITGRTRLRDGDVVRVGRTALAFVDPASGLSSPTATAAAGSRATPPELSGTQREILVALCRPYREGDFAVPATNAAIAGEVHLSVDAVKAHLRTLFARFGLDALPQNQKRAALALVAQREGLVTPRDLG